MNVKEKAFLDREIASVEPLVESFFQFHIMLYLYVTAPKCFGVSNEITISNILFSFKLGLSFIGLVTGSSIFYRSGPFASNLSTDISNIPTLVLIIQYFVTFLLYGLWCMKLVTTTLYIYLMSLNGVLDIGCSNLHTFQILVCMHTLPQILFSLTLMVMGIGIKPTIKVLIRYPAIFGQLILSGDVFSHLDHEKPFHFNFKGDSIQNLLFPAHINNCLMIVMHIIIFTLPLKDDSIIVTFGLIKIDSQQMRILTISLYILAYVIVIYVMLCIPKISQKHWEITTVSLKNLDAYKYEDSDEEDQNSIEITHL